jgi:hypothetical protein
MIVVNVELKSAIHPSRDTMLGRVEIANDGTGSRTVGNYDVRVYDRRGRLTKKTRVENWRRLDKSALRLIAKCIAKAYPEP